MLDRRKFFKLFSAGAAGLTVGAQLALAEDIKNWMLSPQKTIFIPPEPKLVIPSMSQWKLYTVELKIAGEKDGILSPMRYIAQGREIISWRDAPTFKPWVPANGTPEVMADVEKAAIRAYEDHQAKVKTWLEANGYK